jgi:hypothetical protein
MYQTQPPTPVPHPSHLQVSLMEDIIVEELNSLARDVTRNNVNTKFKPADILFALRDDSKKHARAMELLRMEKQMKDLRKVGDLGEKEFE